MMVDMFMDTLICGFQIIFNITKVNEYFVGILNSWIALPTKNTKFKCPTSKNDFTVLPLGIKFLGQTKHTKGLVHNYCNLLFKIRYFITSISGREG